MSYGEVETRECNLGTATTIEGALLMKRMGKIVVQGSEARDIVGASCRRLENLLDCWQPSAWAQGCADGNCLLGLYRKRGFEGT